MPACHSTQARKQINYLIIGVFLSSLVANLETAGLSANRRAELEVRPWLVQCKYKMTARIGHLY
jgi:hypothetical protein